MSAVNVSLMSLVLGGILGLLSALLVSIIRHRQEVDATLLDKYLDVRREVVDVVSELSDLPRLQIMSSEQVDAWSRQVSRLYYRHYDFLPREVLDALLLLHVSLSDPEGRIYAVQNAIVSRASREEVLAFIDKAALIVNTKYLSSLALNSSDSAVRFRQSIRLHARYVLVALNRFASPRDLRGIARRFKKSTAGGRL